VPEDQSEVIAFLADPATHSGAQVDRIDTHSAHVFLAGDTAWKMKRAVKYDYLDFSTLGKRKAILERELSLNAPAAPSIYRRVVPVTRGPGGGLALGGAGEPVEYALEMRRFPAGAQLDRVAEAGRLDDALARDLGDAVASYHHAAERRPEDGADLIREILEELARVFAGMHMELGREAIDAFDETASRLHARLAPLLSRRTSEGHVRRCHSDLHLANLVLIEGRPVPFDALEFDERLGTCDTGYDLAFLLMDLDHRGLARQANLCLNAWLARTRDFEALAPLPLFLAIRAAIRAMVGVQTARATGSATPPEAAEFLARATGYLTPKPPELIAVGGLSGTGKTTVSRLLAPRLPPVPGAVHLRSDEIRKTLLGADPLTRLPPDAYRAGDHGGRLRTAPLRRAGLPRGGTVRHPRRDLPRPRRAPRRPRPRPRRGLRRHLRLALGPARNPPRPRRGAPGRRLGRRCGGRPRPARPRPGPDGLDPHRCRRRPRRGSPSDPRQDVPELRCIKCRRPNGPSLTPAEGRLRCSQTRSSCSTSSASRSRSIRPGSSSPR
jgi:uncharacterized protein